MKCTECAGTSFTEDSGLRTCNSCGTEVRNFVTLESQDFFLNPEGSVLTQFKKEKLKVELKGIVIFLLQQTLKEAAFPMLSV